MQEMIPTATGEQMAQVDHIMMGELGISVLQLMAAAGLAVVEAARRMLGGSFREKRVLLLAGTGGNGGDALVAGRHMLARGARPSVVLSKLAQELPEAAAHQQKGAAVVGVPFTNDGAFQEEYDLIVDGLLGFSGRGNPRGRVADLIEAANHHAAPVLAIDIPSGLEATSGMRGTPCIDAAATIALVLPKQGFATEDGRDACGDVLVGDIGVPIWVLGRAGIEAPNAMFAEDWVVPWQVGAGGD